MLGKKLFLTTFCLTLWGTHHVYAAATWEKVAVKSIIAADHYLLMDGRQVQLGGIEALDLNSPDWPARCLTENTKLQLESLLYDHPIKVKRWPGQAHRAHVSKVYLRFGTTDLASFLLSQGAAIMVEVDHTYKPEYKKSQRRAQQRQVGRWGQCDPNLNLKKWKAERGLTPWFYDRYSNYLESGSLGRVSHILAGNKVELDNGLRIKLKDLVVPLVGSKGAENCFADESRDYLSKLLLGHQIYLRGSPREVSEYKTIERDVYLPATRWRSEVWINQVMIEKGFARMAIDSENEILISNQARVWESPIGAWEFCLAKISRQK